MAGSSLNLGGLDDHCIDVVKSSFNLLNGGDDACIVTDASALDELICELAAANVNFFDKNTELLNVIAVGDKYIIQVKERKVNHGYRYNANYDFSAYFLSQLGYKALQNDLGIIRIEPKDPDTNFVVNVLSHIFSSNDLVVHGHERFASKYHVYATDKEAANTLLSDNILDAISDYDYLQISVAHDKFIIFTPELSADSTAAIIKVFGSLSI